MAVGEYKVTNERAYGKAFAITTSDTVDFQVQTLGIMCTVAGNIVAVWEDDSTTTLPISANIIYPLKVRRLGASTTATGLFGFY
jgi:hypothetical protein